MAKTLREIGIDYLTIKPYSQHLQSKNKFQINYEEIFDLGRQIKEYATDDFAIYFRASAMKKMHREKCYRQCYGNIYEQELAQIWEGSRRQEINKRLNDMDINIVCREACRLDEVNKYLDELKHPGLHVNFI